MRRISALVAVCVLVVAAGQVFGQCDDPYDGLLCMHALTDVQALQYDASDGVLSPFWETLAGDYIELVPPTNCGPAANCNFTGEADGSMTIKAAATHAGVYIYAEVTDNVWVDWSGGDSYGDDSVDLYFDALSANDIFTCTDCLIGLYSSTLTYSTQQIQVFMGANAAPASFRYGYYDNNLWSWQAVELTWELAESLYGFKAEIVAVDGATKAQEWFMPWSAFGNETLTGAPAPDQLVGFAGGYNDMDGDNTEPDKLRWPIAGDPWAGDAQTVNYWGDMRMATVAIDKQVTQGQRLSKGSAKEVNVDYFSLQGQKLGARAIQQLSPSAMVLRRARMADGSHQSKMVRVTQ